MLLFLLLAALPLAASDDPAHKLLDQGRVDDAVTMLQNEIHSDPENGGAYNLLCRAYLLIDRWDPAIDACKRAVKIEPKNSEYHLWLGRSYGQKAEHVGSLTAAGIVSNLRDEFETAVRLNPKSVDARADLADFYLEAPWVVGGGEKKAEKQAEEMAKLEPAQADIVRGRIAEKKKDFAVAESDYRQAIQDSGGKAGPWLSLARLYQRLSRFDAMEQAIAHSTDPKLNRPDVLISAAEILIQANHNLPEATHLLERYLATPTPVEDAPVFKAHYLLGTIFERQGSSGQAIAQYQAALNLAGDFSPARDALQRLTARAQNDNVR